MSLRQDLLSLLCTPQDFAHDLDPDAAERWQSALEDWVLPTIAQAGLYSLRDAQLDAWKGMKEKRISLILGPPGTGKTYALSWMALGYLEMCRRHQQPCRIFVTGFTRNAITNLLDAVHQRIDEVTQKAPGQLPVQPPLFFLGTPKEDIQFPFEVLPLKEMQDIRQRCIEADYSIIGATAWGLYRLVQGLEEEGSTDVGAPLFHMVCIDEASQLKVAQGLLSLVGMTPRCRVLVAGDNKQLQPIGEMLEGDFGGRKLGQSLYDFLASSRLPEFPFTETFRLSSPLSRYPGERFYDGRYHSVKEVAARKLALQEGWKEGLESWQQIALDPEHPICVILHEGPLASTQSPFEAKIVVSLAKALSTRFVDEDKPISSEDLWTRHMALLSPHRAQNQLIREKLKAVGLDKNCVVETVERIQGQERDAILMSYTVSDPEFALLEADFLFGAERFNVAITRPKTKLILVVSRNLLDVLPPDEETFQALQTLREYIFAAQEVPSELELRDDQGRQYKASLRIVRFDEDAPMPEIANTPRPELDQVLPMDQRLQTILTYIRKAIQESTYSSARSFDLAKSTNIKDIFPDLRALQRLGWITLEKRPGKYGHYWLVKAFEQPRPPYPCTPDVVASRLEEVIAECTQGNWDPSYAYICNRFDWLTRGEQDQLRPVIDKLLEENKINVSWGKNQWGFDTLSINEPQNIPELQPPPKEPLTQKDYICLNILEDLEAQRINFGVFEARTSHKQLHQTLQEKTQLTFTRKEVEISLKRLQEHGYVIYFEDHHIRTRMAELAREIRYAKQRFRRGDVDKRPFVVRNIKVELRKRTKPRQDQPLQPFLKELSLRWDDVPELPQVFDGIHQMLAAQWSIEAPQLAGFQARSFEAILASWLGKSTQDAFVITADTGSGKTEAACLPLIAGAAIEAMRNTHGTLAVLVYPRVRLATNQAARLVGYLAAFSKLEGLPLITIGLQNKSVPSRFSSLAPYEREEGWEKVGENAFSFPLFACPATQCEGKLHLLPGVGHDGMDKLQCQQCDWSFDGWVGSKERLRISPPHLFLPVTESLHQWQQNPDCGRLFGDHPDCVSPRVILADEIHLYAHIHGVQIGYTLRRLMARAGFNHPDQKQPIAIGMSATLGSPEQVWGRLIGRDSIQPLRPDIKEQQDNPQAREYFYFVQPEVESRGQDIAGASTTIQSLMCLAHGMRRRQGKDGGYRGIVFLDSIDKLKRLHTDYHDAEQNKRLARWRTRLMEDAPDGSSQQGCCGDPINCETFHIGECWYFAANDKRQLTARGPYIPGQALQVCASPIYSGTSSNSEEKIRESDLVFSTSSLEVGFDDPEMILVYQHYAPQNLASFIQRKGRGGRSISDRPITGVTLSIYSPRDTYYFDRPSRMLDVENFEVPTNPENFFVRRGQLLSIVLDALAQWKSLQVGEVELNPTALPSEVFTNAAQIAEHVLGTGYLNEFGVEHLQELWAEALLHPELFVSEDTRTWRSATPWIPQRLFDSINLPTLQVKVPDRDPVNEDVTFGLMESAPGNITRRWGSREAHWVIPQFGQNPWFSKEEYSNASCFRYLEPRWDSITPPTEEQAREQLLAELPESIRERVGKNISRYIARPTEINVLQAGRYKANSEWEGYYQWDLDNKKICAPPPTPQNQREEQTDNQRLIPIHHKSKSYLDGFVIIQTEKSQTEILPCPKADKLFSQINLFKGKPGQAQQTGLKAYRVFWGADIDLRLDAPNQENIQEAQLFAHPKQDDLVLLHGYDIETEGLQFHLQSSVVDEFIELELKTLQQDQPTLKWLKGQQLRYLLESEGRNAGLNLFQAQQCAQIMVSAASIPEQRKALNRLLFAWDSQKLGTLFKQTFEQRLQEHPMLTDKRVEALIEKVTHQSFQSLFKRVMQQVKDESAFKRYLRSSLLHSIAISLRNLFVLYGRGEERRVLCHVKLPIQFGQQATDTITLLENGNHGDGTTRTFVKHLEEAMEDWVSGRFIKCPNANDDKIIRHILENKTGRERWSQLNVRDQEDMETLAKELHLRQDQVSSVMPRITQLLFGTETVGDEWFTRSELSLEVMELRERLQNEIGRRPSTWELIGAAVHRARTSAPEDSHLSRLLHAYSGIQVGNLGESFEARARLADQVYRLHPELCVDGCQACLHGNSDVVPRGQTEATVSRRLLERFVGLLSF